MKLTTTVLTLVLACAALPAVAAQETHVSTKLKVRAAGRRRVSISERGRSHILDLTGKVDAAKIEDASVLFLTRKGGFIYLLVDVCGPSKAPQDARHCGAGVECNVIWLKLDERWRMLDARAELYESCWLPVTSDEGPHVKEHVMKLMLEDLREWVRREVSYDADRPEAGLTFEFWVIPKQND